MIRALPGTKKTLNKCCYFSHVDLLTYALLFIPSVSALVWSLIIQLFPYHLLSSVLPCYTCVPKPHPSHPPYHHQIATMIIFMNHSLKYVLGVYCKAHTSIIIYMVIPVPTRHLEPGTESRFSLYPSTIQFWDYSRCSTMN